MKTGCLPADRVRELARRAIESGTGEQASACSVVWDISAGCLNPRFWTIEGRPADAIGRAVDGAPMWLDLVLRCRRCEVCLRARTRMWAARARHEIQAAARTWFGTLTLSPESHYVMACRARKAKPDEMQAGGEKEFRARHGEISKELTKFLKRVRKNCGAPLRYLLVAESHQSGLPHYHALVHQVFTDRPVTWRQLHDQWSLGYSLWKLIDRETKVARYVAKYLSCSATRVRASLAYGQGATPLEEWETRADAPAATHAHRDPNKTPPGAKRRAMF